MTAPEPIDRLIDEAAALRGAGRVPQAIAAYERLLALEPELPNCWYNLALLQRQARHYDAALASYQQALDRGVAEPEEVHLNRGVIYADHLRRDDAAECELQAALALKPRYTPALFNLANLQEDRGRRSEARALYERILAIDPGAREALARLAGVSSMAGSDDALVRQLRLALAEPGCSAEERASLGFGLGRLLDGCAAYDEAFAAYAQANRDSAAAAGAGARHDRRAHERFIDALIDTFDGGRTAPPAVAPGPTGTRAPPVFICGMFRSGSTLAEQVLASHREVTPGGELDLLPAMAQSALAPFPASLRRLDPAQLRAQMQALAAGYLSELERLFPGAATLTDKRPDNYLLIGLIKTLFPDAKIVHTLRDALDNCLSIYFLHLDHGMRYAMDLQDIADHYRQYRRLMAHWRRLYGADILDLDYDAFVRAPRCATETLLDFCGLAWDENCLHFERLSNTVKTASVWQVRMPLYGHASGRWRHYRRHLQPLAEALGDPRLLDREPAAAPPPDTHHRRDSSDQTS